MDRLAELTEMKKRMEVNREFLQYIQLLARHPGRPMEAIAEAQAKGLERAARRIKTAVTGGTTSGSAWADDLAFDTLAAGWLSMLSASTLIGRLPFRRADFNTRMLTEVSPGSASWVAEGAAGTASRLSLDATTLTISKIVGFVFLTNEVVKLDTTASLAAISRSMINVVGRYTDVALLDPTIAAVAAKNPASLTNSGTFVQAAGATTEATITTMLKALLQVLSDYGADMTQVQLVMHPMSAIYLASLLTAGNIRAFPNIGARGGEIFGVPVLTSVGATVAGSPSERLVAAINPEGVLLADGIADFVASNKGAFQMDDAPTNSAATPTATSLVSLWQAESTAIRVTRYLNWKAMTGAVSYARVTW